MRASGADLKSNGTGRKRGEDGRWRTQRGQSRQPCHIDTDIAPSVTDGDTDIRAPTVRVVRRRGEGERAARGFVFPLALRPLLKGAALGHARGAAGGAVLGGK